MWTKTQAPKATPTTRRISAGRSTSTRRRTSDPPARTPAPFPAPSPSAAKAAPAPRASARTLDEASRAVERALLAAERDPDPDRIPTPPASSAHAEDLAGWSEPEEDPEDDDAKPGDAPPAAEAPPRPSRRGGCRHDAEAGGRRPARGPRLPRSEGAAPSRGVAGALPASEGARLRVLVGVVVALSILLVGGIVWVLLPRPRRRRSSSPSRSRPTCRAGVSDPDAAIRLPKEAIAVTTSFTLFDGQDPTVFEERSGQPDALRRAVRPHLHVGLLGRRQGHHRGRACRACSPADGRCKSLDARSARENGATSMRFAYQSGVAIRSLADRQPRRRLHRARHWSGGCPRSAPARRATTSSSSRSIPELEPHDRPRSAPCGSTSSTSSAHPRFSQATQPVGVRPLGRFPAGRRNRAAVLALAGRTEGAARARPTLASSTIQLETRACRPKKKKKKKKKSLKVRR